MSIEALEALPVGKMLHEQGSVLWLWATNMFMLEALRLVEVWGFGRWGAPGFNHTILTWVKDKIGLGRWLRGQTEHCLVAVRGSLPPRRRNVPTVLHAKATGHSGKPEEFYSLVEGLCPGSKVELFSRQARPGWTCHGDEVRPAALPRDPDAEDRIAREAGGKRA